MKVLSVTYGGGHVRIAAKMANAYKDRGIDYQIVALPGAIPYLRAQSVSYLRLIDFAEYFPEWEAIYGLGKELAKEYHNKDAEFSIEDTICYYGMSYYDLIREHGEEEAREMFKKNGRKSFLPKHSAEIIVKAVSPDIVQLTSGVRMERAVSYAAKKLNIPSVKIQDFPMSFNEMTTDYLLALNNYEKLRNSSLVKNPNKYIIVTGHPCFENYNILNKEIEKAKVINTLDLKGEYIITWVVPGYDEKYNAEIFLTIRDIANNNPDKDFIIKLHPTSHSENMFSGFGELPKNMRKIKNYDTPSLLKASDLVIGDNSTTAFEAILLDCNEIIIEKAGIIDSLNPQIYPAVIVENLAHLEKKMKQLLYDKKLQYFYAEKRKDCRVVKNASENIVNAVEEIHRNLLLEER